jgi:hypothetical protein
VSHLLTVIDPTRRLTWAKGDPSFDEHELQSVNVVRQDDELSLLETKDSFEPVGWLVCALSPAIKGAKAPRVVGLGLGWKALRILSDMSALKELECVGALEQVDTFRLPTATVGESNSFSLANFCWYVSK